MQTIRCLNDLERFGIIPLTGEACGLMYRVLFDLTNNGAKILQRCFGAPTMTFGESWNLGHADDPHVGSIMLAPEMLPAIGIFSLLEGGCLEVWQKGDTLFGVEPTDAPESLETFKKQHGPLRRFTYRGTAGDRNIHQMSGRVK